MGCQHGQEESSGHGAAGCHELCQMVKNWVIAGCWYCEGQSHHLQSQHSKVSVAVNDHLLHQLMALLCSYGTETLITILMRGACLSQFVRQNKFNYSFASTFWLKSHSVRKKFSETVVYLPPLWIFSIPFPPHLF